MPSSLFASQNQQPNNVLSMIRQFDQFKNSFGSQDPKQIVQSLLQSGRMSQEQFRQLSQTADELSKVLR